MSIIVIVFLLVGTYGGYEYLRVAPLVTVGRALAKDAVTYQREGDYQKTILVVGDSTAVGVGSASSESVAARLADWLDASVENRAVSGAKVIDITKQIQNAQNTHYDLVIVHGGANDVIYGSSYETVSTEIRRILSTAHSLSEHVVLLTAGDIGQAPLWPRPVGMYLTHRTEKLRNTIMPLVTESDGLYIDLYTFGDPFSTDPKKYYAPDFLHLSGEGYGVWFDFIVREMKEKWPAEYGEV